MSRPTALNEQSGLRPAPSRQPGLARSPKLPAEIDLHVAARIRDRRVMLRITQRELGRMIGASYRQVYKYEQGLNRASASVLYAMSRALGVPVGYFFEGVDKTPLKPGRLRSRLSKTMLAFAAIRPENHQKAFSDLVRALAEDKLERSDD